MSIRRVAYVLNRFPKISQTFIVGELAELRRRGINVLILSLRRSKDAFHHRIVDRAGLLTGTVFGRDAFLPALRDFRPQLLHAHFATGAAGVARSLSAELGVPYTFTAHGYDLFRRPPKDLTQRARSAAAVITVSEANAVHMATSLRIPREKVHVILNGVDTNSFRPKRQAASPPHIVCVARLTGVKNHALLLQACNSLLKHGLEFRCVLVGDGPSREELILLRRRLGLDDVVEMTGAVQQDAVLAWWQRASVAVLTSESEGLGICLIEAAACEIPAVATNVGGIPEVIEDGVTGLLVPSGDVDATANALERLLRDDRLRAQMGQAARARVLERFSLDRQINQLLALWNAIA